ncbi:hypothetical protein EB796_008275 [Bugula neritina]|uniref:Uncharacterized protein n=1 Tax=Bugula neritina TaxID=10212 RepID=A0A7J7K627_BUGNE|nr:hypothetical protein EB796_008275 [Bugula neritina]
MKWAIGIQKRAQVIQHCHSTEKFHKFSSRYSTLHSSMEQLMTRSTISVEAFQLGASGRWYEIDLSSCKSCRWLRYY